jgi:hypothetical protein
MSYYVKIVWFVLVRKTPPKSPLFHHMALERSNTMIKIFHAHLARVDTLQPVPGMIHHKQLFDEKALPLNSSFLEDLP